LIAEAVLEVPAKSIARWNRTVYLAESALAVPWSGFGGVDAYPDFAAKTAVLCWHLVRNHPLPDGNKRTGYLCMREFIARNGHEWHRPHDDVDDTVRVIERVAAGVTTELQLQAWIEERLV
jgi:death on curing protein